jgi:hypothetical protein
MQATYESAADLAAALRRAAAAQGRHEEEIGHADPDWPDCTGSTWWTSRQGAPARPGDPHE